jgi:hypothetical protein
MNNFPVTKSEPVTLHDGSKASRVFYTRIKQAAELGIQKMRAGVPTTLRKICGNGIWRTLVGGEVSLAGLCGVTMARKGELPLTLLGEKDAKNARLYLLK